MSITFVNTRELSRQPARVLRRVKRYGPQIITQNGVPAAYLVPTSALGIEVDIDTIRSLHFAQTLATAQTEAARAGTSGMSMEAIDAEISAMRTERRRTRR